MATAIIQANYDELAQIAARWHQQQETSEALDRRLKACLQSLEHGGWEGRGADAFFSEMHGEVLPALARFTEALEVAKSVTLEIRTQMRQAEEDAASPFKQKGGHGPDAGGGSSGGGGGGGGGGAWGGGDDPVKGAIKTLKGVLGDIKNVVAARDLWHAFQSAQESGGGLKEVWGFFKEAQNGKSLFRKGLSWAGKALDVGSELYDNWVQYNNGENAIVQIAAGTATDLAITAGFTMGGRWLGGALGGTLGSVLGPVGTAIGAGAGSFIGGWLGGLAGEWVGDTDFVNNTVEHAVDWSVNKVKDVGGQVANTTVNFVQQQAHNIDEGLRNVGNTIGNLFKPRLALFGG
ncbi:WXG100 family type VII secretion target [Chloroflexales bacterium ZM16-3]|nr:WXG100 family type VII secretion target [Chloroflexales bacterium ZM16-3]